MRLVFEELPLFASLARAARARGEAYPELTDFYTCRCFSAYLNQSNQLAGENYGHQRPR